MTRTSGAEQFAAQLADRDLLVPTNVPGIYYRSATFERIVRALAEFIQRAGAADEATLLLPAPLLPREVFERTGYLRSFPDLTGSLDTFVGGDREHAELLRVLDSGADWAHLLAPADLVLAPAACYALYPQLTGRVSGSGALFEVESWCFRHEPSADPTRLQSFRMREFVYAGTPGGALAHRDRWLDRSLTLLAGLGLSVEAAPANDPFFGRAGRVLAAAQRASALKYEIVTPIGSPDAPDAPVAVASANYHEDHFGVSFAISTPDGRTAHSACFGFGLERVALALLFTHGLDPVRWPVSVTDQLWG